MNNLESIFLGVSKRAQCGLYRDVFVRLLATHPTLILPCAGTLKVASVALKAGYKAGDIYTSDISLFSTVLGNLVTGQRVPDFPDLDPALPDLERAARIMHAIKVSQLRDEILYEKEYKRYFVENAEKCIERLQESLKKKCTELAGIHYEQADIRSVLEKDPDGAVVAIHAPAYARGYSKMFELEAKLNLRRFAEYDFKKEFKKSYAASREKKALYIWSYYAQNLKDVPLDEIFFAEEVGKDKFEFYLTTKPDLVKASPFRGQVLFKKSSAVAPLPIPVVSTDYDITAETKIQIIKVTREQAMYYRDLWAHKMGATDSEVFFLITLDGMAFGITGIHTDRCFKMQDDGIHETFGFDQPIRKHPKAHRLFMMLLTCKDFQTAVANGVHKNRIFEIAKFKTVCKLKSSNGLLTITNRERLPNGLYKLAYECEFRPRSFHETLLDWMAECKATGAAAPAGDAEGEGE